jgi:large subunit ribosomal protein L9e
MRQIHTSKSLPIPAGVKVTIKNRKVTVTGPRGTLSRDFQHLRVDLRVAQNKAGKQNVVVELWFGNRLSLATLRTALSHISNMMVGVTKGFLFKMKYVYNHFPINLVIQKGDKVVEVRNYLGEKMERVVTLIGDTTAKLSKDIDGTKDEITLQGSSLDDVSQSAANIQQIAKVKDKDIRKFLDGVYVSYRGNIVQEE